MKKLLVITVCFLLGFFSLYGQSPFEITPKSFDNDYQGLDISSNTDYVAHDSYLANNTDSAFTYLWEVKMGTSCPEEYKVGISDINQSYIPGVHQSPQETTLGVDQTNSPFNANLYPFQTAGCCDFVAYFLDANDPSIILDSINYKISINDENCLLSSSKNQTKLSEVKISPNPVQDQINISSLEHFDEIRISNSAGLVQKIIKSPNRIENLTELQAGIYFLHFYLKNKLVGLNRMVKI